MKVNGIIAEYNPFHNGHKYQLEESLRLTGADYTVVVMSGNFVQRGAPALADKHLRTEMALRCGADLVLELPVLYAASSAEFFAAGAVSLLDRLGVVTHLCFGSEWGDIEILENVAEFLLEEPEEYQTALKDALKKGLSYPKARGEAIAMLSGDRAIRSDNKITLNEEMTTPMQTGNEQEDKLSGLLSLPNNILGIEYIRALRKRHSSIQPFTIKRVGAGYHDILYHDKIYQNKMENELNNSRESGTTVNLSCSAFAIRQALQEGISPLHLTRYMPQEAGNLLLTWLEKKRPVHADDFSSILYYKLLTDKQRGYDRYLDVSSDLSDRIKNKLGEFTGFEAFCDLLKTKNITHARISRCLIHILLGIEKEDMTLGKSLDHAPYARILGFRKSAVPLLGAIKACASIPLISKLADADRILSPDAAMLLAKDIIAGDIYRGILYAGTGCAAPSEYTIPLVIL